MYDGVSGSVPLWSLPYTAYRMLSLLLLLHWFITTTPPCAQHIVRPRALTVPAAQLLATTMIDLSQVTHIKAATHPYGGFLFCVARLLFMAATSMNRKHPQTSVSDNSLAVTNTPWLHSFTSRSTLSLLVNPLSPHDAIKHHFTSLKTHLIFLQRRVLEWTFPWN